MKHLIRILALVVAACANGQGLTDSSTSPITLSAGDLTATFADNTAYGEHHRARYNGISELRHASATDNLFVPAYAGFNLEHFFGGDFLEELFEPREHPMVLTQVDDRTVKLYQPPPPRSKVETSTLFTLVPPHYIDVEVDIILHDLSPFQHGYAGLFWASYIHQPEDMKIYFWGLENGEGDPTWVAASTPKHGVLSSHLHVEDDYQAYYAENFNTTLASNFSEHRYLEPFYYGLSGDMVYAIFFDRTEGIRFSQSPSGGGEGNPAWDHHLLIPDPQVAKIYTYRARLMYKPFKGGEDVREEFHQWWERVNRKK
jgi:hypothetical protein